MSTTPRRRRRLRARPLLVAVGTIALAGVGACFGFNGVRPAPDGGYGGTGGVAGGGDELPDLSATEPSDMKPSNSD
jgi:hypothetical protein